MYDFSLGPDGGNCQQWLMSPIDIREFNEHCLVKVDTLSITTTEAMMY